MVPRDLFFLFLFFIFVIAFIAFIVTLRVPEKFEQLKKPDAICAFDIDGTITVGIDRAAKAIAKCKEIGAIVAINTARPSKWYDDLDLYNLGLINSDFDSNFYHGEPFKCSFTNINCFEDSIANTKVKHLHTLSIKWGIKPDRIILFDDQWRNIEKAKQAGFSAIYANHEFGGLPDNVVEQIENILNEF